MLAHLDQRYGGVEAYLMQAGISLEDVMRLRGRRVDAAERQVTPAVDRRTT